MCYNRAWRFHATLSTRAVGVTVLCERSEYNNADYYGPRQSAVTTSEIPSIWSLKSPLTNATVADVVRIQAGQDGWLYNYSRSISNRCVQMWNVDAVEIARILSSLRAPSICVADQRLRWAMDI